MLKHESLKAEPAQDYDNLKRQFFALKRLCESKMHQCQIYSQKLADYDRESVISRNEALNSERDMNAILTQENEQLRAENEALKKAIEHVIPTINEATKRAKRKEVDFSELAPCLTWASQILSQAAKGE